ncbi:hypothetical protein BIY24_04025 [Halobacteriovorax marinus]|uniref:Uncharacterized protein n=1 Tax=Halobacteriovorax marinus (strain ATCC BAA-682 / DSM 15412 / SJ) TaxID=862908 RepID=E1WX38_HALMS|nr:hypothetical protein [Halobacteriovorax marinus]ATH07132.1 hypothetical protein BIY24_04025 [Halobacteriovorax marinus]CBW25739.1 hypothetical protein BMS_0844 [Halobacteriovorax marinus SJ]
MYESTRRYRKNDWWDLVVVIDQVLEKDKSFESFYYIVDELKWRIVDSVSEGGNFKIRSKAKEIKKRYEDTCEEIETLSETQKCDIDALFDFILSSKNDSF